ncbi:ChrR family anti-sigma-E factor [Roseobacter sp. YSTF-M11]|uniref:ChrR family anti-sigma-E factor n=1 Tax=Roseobacter insulae TaxID=2859783 RepID=A0A9X1FRT1_9RHOB|nr:ChrR family anti-sigma-E factor [Roseobacter insulae]MBW4706472.1 ChrR family anti-sigma-E factor [Roseobacter insulae]
MTDNIKHHLNDAVLMAYSAGSLPEAFNLMVAAHLSLCDACRARAESFDALGGEVLEQLESAAVAALRPGSYEATLALIAGGPVAEKTRDDLPCAVLPKPLRDYVGGDLNAVRWKPVGMGVKQAILPTSKDASARLLLIPAGTAMPDHGHHGTEMTMVLQGAFQDEDDYFARGDVEIADSDLHHTPVADIHEDCICLAVTDAPLQFDRLIPKIAQRFLRI